jgi:hypothetical protein
LEFGYDAALCRLASSPVDGAHGDVDAHCLGTVLCSQQGVLAGSAADVEHPALQLAGLGQPHERGLRPADVPGR